MWASGVKNWTTDVKNWATCCPRFGPVIPYSGFLRLLRIAQPQVQVRLVIAPFESRMLSFKSGKEV